MRASNTIYAAGVIELTNHISAIPVVTLEDLLIVLWE